MHLAAADCGALRDVAHPLLQAVASLHVEAAIDNANEDEELPLAPWH